MTRPLSRDSSAQLQLGSAPQPVLARHDGGRGGVVRRSVAWARHGAYTACDEAQRDAAWRGWAQRGRLAWPHGEKRWVGRGVGRARHGTTQCSPHIVVGPLLARRVMLGTTHRPKKGMTSPFGPTNVWIFKKSKRFLAVGGLNIANKF